MAILIPDTSGTNNKRKNNRYSIDASNTHGFSIACLQPPRLPQVLTSHGYSRDKRKTMKVPAAQRSTCHEGSRSLFVRFWAVAAGCLAIIAAGLWQHVPERFGVGLFIPYTPYTNQDTGNN